MQPTRNLMQGESREQLEEMLFRLAEGGRSERRVCCCREALQVLVVYEGDMYMVENVMYHLATLNRIKLKDRDGRK